MKKAELLAKYAKGALSNLLKKYITGIRELSHTILKLF